MNIEKEVVPKKLNEMPISHSIEVPVYAITYQAFMNAFAMDYSVESLFKLENAIIDVRNEMEAINEEYERWKVNDKKDSILSNEEDRLNYKMITCINKISLLELFSGFYFGEVLISGLCEFECEWMRHEGRLFVRLPSMFNVPSGSHPMKDVENMAKDVLSGKEPRLFSEAYKYYSDGVRAVKK